MKTPPNPKTVRLAQQMRLLAEAEKRGIRVTGNLNNLPKEK